MDNAISAHRMLEEDLKFCKYEIIKSVALGLKITVLYIYMSLVLTKCKMALILCQFTGLRLCFSICVNCN